MELIWILGDYEKILITARRATKRFFFLDRSEEICKRID